MVFCSSFNLEGLVSARFCSHQYPAKGQTSGNQTKWHLWLVRHFLINCFGLWKIHPGQYLPLAISHRYAAFIQGTVIDPKQWLLSLHSPPSSAGRKLVPSNFKVSGTFASAKSQKVGRKSKADITSPLT